MLIKNNTAIKIKFNTIKGVITLSNSKPIKNKLTTDKNMPKFINFLLFTNNPIHIKGLKNRINTLNCNSKCELNIHIAPKKKTK